MGEGRFQAKGATTMDQTAKPSTKPSPVVYFVGGMIAGMLMLAMLVFGIVGLMHW